jgi:hypothetical protein
MGKPFLYEKLTIKLNFVNNQLDKTCIACLRESNPLKCGLEYQEAIPGFVLPLRWHPACVVEPFLSQAILPIEEI